MFARRTIAKSLVANVSRHRFSSFRGIPKRNFRFIGYVAAVGAASLCAGAVAEASCHVDFAAVRKDIVSAIEADDKKRGDGTSMGPTLVRYFFAYESFESVIDLIFADLRGILQEPMIHPLTQEEAMVLPCDLSQNVRGEPMLV